METKLRYVNYYCMFWKVVPIQSNKHDNTLWNNIDKPERERTFKLTTVCLPLQREATPAKKEYVSLIFQYLLLFWKLHLKKKFARLWE